MTVTLVAWGVLVYAAIDFGREARSGEPTAWVFLVVTTLGAAAALFVTLILGARIMTLFRGRNEPSAAAGAGASRRRPSSKDRLTAFSWGLSARRPETVPLAP